MRAAFTYAVQRPVRAVLAVALLVRLLVLVAAGMVRDGVLIPDEVQYLELGALAASGRIEEFCCGGYGPELYASTRFYMWQVHGLVSVFGPERWALQLLAIVYGSLTAVLVVLILQRLVSRSWALAGGVAIALWPSSVLHSIVVLRETLILAILASVGLIVLDWARTSETRRLATGGVGLLVAVVCLGWLRDQTAVVTAWAILPAALVVRGGRWSRGVVALFVLLLAPWLTGTGPGGLFLIEDALPRLGTVRAWMSMEAESAHVTFDEVPVSPVSPVSSGNMAIGAGASAIVTRPVDQIKVDGVVLDVVRSTSGQQFIVDNSVSSSLKILPGGLSAFFFRPFVWEDGGLEFRLAAVEGLAWTGLYILALVGLRSLWMERPDFGVFAVAWTVGMGMVAAISQGNLGTAFRHRGQLLWLVVCLAVLGLSAVRTRRMAANCPEAGGEEV